MNNKDVQSPVLYTLEFHNESQANLFMSFFISQDYEKYLVDSNGVAFNYKIPRKHIKDFEGARSRAYRNTLSHDLAKMSTTSTYTDIV